MFGIDDAIIAASIMALSQMASTGIQASQKGSGGGSVGQPQPLQHPQSPPFQPSATRMAGMIPGDVSLQELLGKKKQTSSTADTNDLVM